MTWFLGGVTALYFVFARLTFHLPMSGLSSAHELIERTTITRTRAVILAFICFLHCELETACMLGATAPESQIRLNPRSRLVGELSRWRVQKLTLYATR